MITIIIIPIFYFWLCVASKNNNNISSSPLIPPPQPTQPQPPPPPVLIPFLIIELLQHTPHCYGLINILFCWTLTVPDNSGDWKWFFSLGLLYSIGILFYSFALRYFKEAPRAFHCNTLLPRTVKRVVINCTSPLALKQQSNSNRIIINSNTHPDMGSR